MLPVVGIVISKTCYRVDTEFRSSAKLQLPSHSALRIYLKYLLAMMPRLASGLAGCRTCVATLLLATMQLSAMAAAAATRTESKIQKGSFNFLRSGGYQRTSSGWYLHRGAASLKTKHAQRLVSGELLKARRGAA